MRNKPLIAVIALWAMLSCARRSSETTSSSTHSGVIEDAGGAIVAYVVGWSNIDNVNVYIPSADRYATVDVQSGNYAFGGNLLYSSANCTGTPVLSSVDYGISGKVVAYDGGQDKYFISSTEEILSDSNTHTYNSYYYQGTCGVTTIMMTAGQIWTDCVEESRPYDFTSLAPIELNFP